MNRAKLNNVLHRAYTHSFSIQSNYARRYAQEVAALASLGMITTQVVRGQTPVFGKLWRVSKSGMAFLSEEGVV